MCLVKDNKYHPCNRPLIAEENILCYKVLTQVLTGGSPDEFLTPYQLEPIRMSVYLNCRIPFIAWDDSKLCSFWRHKLGFSRIVESGFIHTFRVEHAIRVNKYESVFKCIIPKGTKYFVGINNDYASERIIFLEKLV
jgi:hypothetical protein